MLADSPFVGGRGNDKSQEVSALRCVRIGQGVLPWLPVEDELVEVMSNSLQFTDNGYIVEAQFKFLDGNELGTKDLIHIDYPNQLTQCNKPPSGAVSIELQAVTERSLP